MVLVLAVSIVGIVAILNWGAPAIDQMKANVETKSVESQFNELLADVQELVAGTAGKTAKRWQPSLQRGSIVMDNSSERWLVSVDMRKSTGTEYSFEWGCMDDNDHAICIKNTGVALASARMYVYVVDGTLETRGKLTDANNPAGGDVSTASLQFNASEVKVLYLWDVSNKGAALEHKTLNVEIWDGTTRIASEAWIYNTGRVHYELATQSGLHELTFTNGAIIQGTNEQYVLLNAPPIPPPKTTAGKYRLFARLVEIDGSGGFGGADRFDTLLNLYGTSAWVDLDCSTTSSDADDPNCIKRVRFYPLGTLAPVWLGYFTPENGYAHMTTVPNANDVGDTPALQYIEYEPATTTKNGFTLVYSAIIAES